MPVHTGSVSIPKPFVARAIEEAAGLDEGFVADRVLPILPSRVQDGTLGIVQREDMLRIENTVVAKASNYGRVHFREEGLEFHCVKNGLEQQVTDEDKAFYSEIFDAEVVAARQVYGMLRRSRENRVASALFSATWTGGGATLYTDVSGSAPWATTTSDVVTTVAAAAAYVQKNCGFLPNALIMNTDNVNRLIANTVIRARFPGAAFISRQMILDNLASIFGIPYLIECSAIKNSAAEGAAHTGAFIWSSSYVGVARIRTGNAPEEPGLGVTVKWNAVQSMLNSLRAIGAPAATQDASIEVFAYDEPQTDSEVIKVRQYIDELVLGSAYMHLLKVA